MPETTPQAGVPVEATDVQTRMQNFLAQSEKDQEQEVEAEAPAPENKAPVAQPTEPEGQAPEELTADDLESEVKTGEQPAVDAFEIVHNGQQIKLSREETIKHAQQGFDYTRKTEALAAEKKAVGERLAKLAEVEKVHPYLIQQQGQVKALEAQLQPYQNVDWVQLAAQDVNSYAQHRAQYDVLVNSYNRAVNQYQQGYSAVRQQLSEVEQSTLKQEEAKLPELIPEWTDPAKRDAGKAELLRYYTGLGVPQDALVGKLNDAMSVSIALKAMKYDKLVKAKTEKVKQLRTAPPVTVPGAKGNSTKADMEQKLSDRLHKTGDVKDAAALLLNRWK